MQFNVPEKFRRHQLASYDPMNQMITTYLVSPPGQKMIQDYLSSPEGKRGICEFTSTKRGRETMKEVIPNILSCLALPKDLQLEVRKTLKEIP